MHTRTFGPTGISTTVIGLGGMPLSIGDRPDEATGVRVIHAALDAGMRLIDTADVYCLDEKDIGHNERLIAKALSSWSGDASSVLVATKGGLERPNGDWVTNGHPDHLQRACEASLKALGVDAITVYQLHAPDDDVPFAESVGALARLKEQGKIVHVGLSNVSVEAIDDARAIVPIVSVQNRCNPYDLRAWSGGVVQHCEALGIAFLPYSPVGGGRGHVRLADDVALEKIGSQYGASPYEVALAWLLAKSDAMFPIPGASKVPSATSSAKAADLSLSDTDVQVIDAHVGFGRAVR
ncbi:MAG: aldo/keto reductase [Sandaracinaceae bacterium]